MCCRQARAVCGLRRCGWLRSRCRVVCIPQPPPWVALPLPVRSPNHLLPHPAPFPPHRPTRPQVIAQLELWNERESGKYEKRVYVLPKHLDEKVAALHLPKLGAKLTVLSADQAAYINVPVGGPYKPAHYRFARGRWEKVHGRVGALQKNFGSHILLCSHCANAQRSPACLPALPSCRY
jgi:hypothetical protein